MGKKIVVVGAGFAGCGAAAAAARAGADVTLLEKTDVVTGVGQFAGGFASRGEQFPVHEEIKAMGAGDIAEALESEIIWSRSGSREWFWRDCRTGAEPVGKALKKVGVNIIYRALATDVEMSGKKVKAVKLKDGRILELDAVIDATGGTGPPAMCEKWGTGCVGCSIMCPQFGGRVSIAAKAGVKEWAAFRPGGGKKKGSYSDTVHAVFETVSPELQEQMKEKGTIEIPLSNKLSEILFQRITESGIRKSYTREEAKRLVITDMGYVRIGMPFIKREELRQIRGLEKVEFVSPACWWVGNAIRYIANTPRDNTLKAEGVDNLFVAGEKIGHLQSITPCYVTGALAGHNAVRKAAGMKLLELPRTTAIGEMIAFGGELNQKDKIHYNVYSLTRLREKGLFTRDVPKIQARVKEQGLSGIFAKKLV